MSVAATAGAVAWVVPEILTAKPAAGAMLSGTNATTTGSPINPTTSPNSPTTSPSSAPGSGGPGALAFTGIDVQREVEIGAALIAGGWAMHRWASRNPTPATEQATEAHETGSQVDPT